VKKSIVIIIIGVLCLSMSSVFSTKANTTFVPNGIVYSIPITLTNTQSMATPTPYQQMISVDSSKYSGYEAPNLKNVEFFDSSGTVIYSWLESGAASSSTNTIYWLNLPNGIAAKSSVTIYLGFASPTTNLLNGQAIGEAPTLSSNYGQYDNGRNVFAFYDNFAGTTLSTLWVDNSAQTKNTFTIDNGIAAQPAQAFNNWTSINSVKTFSQGVTEFYGTIPTGDNGAATFDGVLVGLICQTGWDSMIGCVAGSYGLITKDGGNWNTAEGLSFGTASIYSLIIPSATSSLRMAQVNYAATISGNSNPLTLPQPIGLQNQRRSGLALGPIYWIRERAYPPNSVVPSVAINGQSSSTPQSNNIFSNPLVIAAIIAAILAGVGAAVFYFVIAGDGGEAGSAGTGVVGGAVGSASGTEGSGGAGSGGGAGSSGGEGEGSGGSGSNDTYHEYAHSEQDNLMLRTIGNTEQYNPAQDDYVCSREPTSPDFSNTQSQVPQTNQTRTQTLRETQERVETGGVSSESQSLQSGSLGSVEAPANLLSHLRGVASGQRDSNGNGRGNNDASNQSNNSQSSSDSGGEQSGGEPSSDSGSA